jgi:hypothetical protein
MTIEPVRATVLVFRSTWKSTSPLPRRTPPAMESQLAVVAADQEQPG